ncbi:7-cyano-7-deazaguanine synthase [Endozoicomonas sp. SM1973]|uniref:asparagine synthase (glutamine-hydrolyzing) n=1 Tax=Spartinivicinus marinus TaxID=2994442 RepID=A0A853I2E7_9GAMM|nr:asparagine synthase-related protein [Spartinivicinus marinus]MCX4026876.1 asparagine synthase-related protein [Spartinivicinus marinus]NYZ66779.1 7-cyano-7-deazaguanine synthase [Spartinivicinus marinus]
MTGLVGYFGNQPKTVIQKMASQLEHRFANGLQQVTTEALVAAVGTVPENASQNFHVGVWKKESVTLIINGFFTGDSYNTKPHDVVTSYLRSGINELCRLEGAFIIVLYDKQSSVGYLIRDGAGQKTLYFSQINQSLFFAVEPKAIHQLSLFTPQLNNSALAQYLSFSFVPGCNTMLKGLYELPAGHYLTWKNHEYSIKRYFLFEQEVMKENHQYHDADNSAKQFKKLLTSAVLDRLPANRELGIFLSGGLDSSVVTAELASLYQNKLNTFSIHFGKKYPNELEYARQVAERYKTSHHEVHIKPKHFLHRLKNIIWLLDDPIGDPITVPNFELAQYASNYSQWIFNGEGGDPCFGGPKNYGMLLSQWYGTDFMGLTRQTREVTYLKSFQRAYDELEKLLTPDVKHMFSHEEDLVGVLSPFFNTKIPDTLLNKLMAMNIRLKGAHLILPKVERMLQAHRLHSLSPLFDERIVRFSFRLPGKQKISYGDEKLVMKRAYQLQLPKSIIIRPKSGMRVPVQFWCQGEMKRYIKHVFSKKAVNQAGIFNYDRLKQLINYNTGEHNMRFGIKLWMLLSFEIWRKQVIEKQAA